MDIGEIVREVEVLPAEEPETAPAVEPTSAEPAEEPERV